MLYILRALVILSIFSGFVSAQTVAQRTRPPRGSARVTHSNNEIVQFVQKSGTGLHALLFDKLTFESSVVTMSGNNELGRTLKLPPDQRYLGLGVTTSGSFIVPSMALGKPVVIDEYDRNGSLVRTIPGNVRSQVVGYTVSGDVLARLLPDCSLDLLDLNSLMWTTARVPGVTCLQSQIASVDQDSVAVLDPTTARVTWLNVRAGQQDTVQFSSPEVDAALQYVEEHPILSGDAQDKRLKLFALSASSVESDGIYALLGPMRGKTGVIIMGTRDGYITRRLEVEIPADRAVTPHWISAEGNAVRLIYRTGHVDLYDAHE